ncbi:MAG TPA: VOC family protein [Gemmatirosa sp.]
MSTAQAPVPVITNAGNRPATRHKLFVNVPVADLQRSIRFFEALGFRFSPQFTDAQGTCMLVGEDAYFMLLTKERFGGFSRQPVPDPRAGVGALFTISVDSRAAVDAMVRAALAAGGSAHVAEPEDHGFMYDWSFLDPDGHGWGVFWMDPSAIPGDDTGGGA